MFYNLKNTNISYTYNVNYFINYLKKIDNYEMKDTFNRVNKRYSSIFLTFDSETNQVYNEIDEHYTSNQILWQIGHENVSLLVRNIEDYLYFLEEIKINFTENNKYSKNGKKIKNGKKVIFYAHNLSYDTYFMTEYIVPRITEQFNIKNKITRYVLDDLLEFRCSHQLLKMSLERAIQEYANNDNIFKDKGMWDYNKIRTSKTTLTEDEIYYAVIDVIKLWEILVNVSDINDCNVAELPHTGTGFTRRRMKKTLFGEIGNISYEQKKYREFVKGLTLTTEQFYLAELCYFGGMSDTNPLKANKVVKGVGYWDIASEYPTAQVLYKFPCSSPVMGFLSEKEILEYGNVNSDIGYIAKLEITNLKCKAENPIPNIIKYEEFENCENLIMSGSRVYGADKIIIYTNHIDFAVLKDMYTFDTINVLLSYKYNMDYLPTIFVNMVLDGFEYKTKYKVRGGKKYLQLKVDLNTYYGITAMNPLHTEYVYDFEGVHRKDEQLSDDELIDKYNKSPNRTSFYLWGQYTASYGHYMLTRGMKKVKNNLIACDTDSLMTIGENDKLFTELNNEMLKRIEFVSEHIHNIPLKKFMPCDENGNQVTLGFWESENYHKDYGKLTAIISKRPKCYLKIYEKGYSFTTAGVNGKKVLDYYDLYLPNSITSAFIKNKPVPIQHSGKLTHRYVNEQNNYMYCDDEFNIETITNKYCVTLEPTTFEFADKPMVEKINEMLEYVSADVYM